MFINLISFSFSLIDNIDLIIDSMSNTEIVSIEIECKRK